jgi:hypothetical protein
MKVKQDSQSRTAQTGHTDDPDSRKIASSSMKILIWKKVSWRQTHSSFAWGGVDLTVLSAQAVPCLSYTTSSIYMTLAQKYVVSELRSVKSLFLLYQNAAALLLYFPAAAGWLRRFGITRSHACHTGTATRATPHHGHPIATASPWNPC